ncbi:MAG: formylglycine-generating enzyme family protein [Treponema sp.]|nr:formylglycine-generating enzyme family protein [Treponema sp.]
MKFTKAVFGEDTKELVYYHDKEFTTPYEDINQLTCYMDSSKRGFRLPTGKSVDGFTPGGPGFGSRQVGGKAPNELGIYDMSGNVSEWCFDW